MYNIETNCRIIQIITVFNLFGCLQKETVSIKTGRKFIYLTFFVSALVSLASGVVLSNDRSESIFLTSVFLVAVTNAVKLIYILWKKEDIIELIQEISAHSITDHVQFMEIAKKLKQLMDFALFMIWTIVLSIILLFILSLPVFWSEKKLCLNMAFPFDWRNNDIAYWIANSYVFIFATISMMTMLLSIIIWYLMLNCSIKFDVLGHNFRHIGDIEATQTIAKNLNSSDAQKQNLFLQELIALIKTHRNIQTTIHRFKSCFSTLFFTQICTGGLSICCVIYGLVFTQYENVVQPILYVVALVNVIFDVFMIMHFGNEIMLSSNRLSYCLFESQWTDQPESCKKCIIVLTEILKRPQEMVIGKLYPLNLEMFTSILNVAYYAFNIIQNVTK